VSSGYLAASSLLVGVQLVLVVLGADRLAGLVVGAGSGLERVVVGLVSGLCRIVLVVTLLGALGLLHRWPVALVGVAVDVAILWRVPPTPWPRPAAGGRSAVLRAVAAAPVAGIALFWLVSGAGGRSFDYDTRQYHAPNAAFWMRTGSLWRLPPANAGYFTNGYPSDHTLVGTWLLLPSGSDQLVYVVNLVWVLFAMSAVALLVVALGGRASVGFLVGAAVVCAPVILITQVASLQNDLAVIAGVCGSTALVLLARARARPGPLLLSAGLALGLAVGSKYTAWGPAVGIAALALWASPAGRRLRAFGWLALGTTALSGFWLVRNLVATANPVYPLRAGPLAGGDSPLNVYSASLLSHIVHWRTGPLRAWLGFHPEYLGGLTGLFVAGMVAAPFVARARRDVLAVGVLAAFSYVVYLATPFTGGGESGFVVLLVAQLRYGLPALALGAAVAGAAVPWPAVSVGAAASIVHGVWTIVHPPGYRMDLAIGGWCWALVAAGAAVAAGCAARPSFWWPERAGGGAVPATRRRLPRVAGAAAGALAVTAGAAVAIAANIPPASPMAGGVLAVLGRPRGPVVMVAVDDVRALMGPCFTVDVQGVGIGGVAGERPPGTTIALDRRIEELHPAVVAVGQRSNPVVAPGWQAPPGWKKVGRTGQADLYVPPGATLAPVPVVAHCDARAPEPR
jgi:hypothetical protein